MGSLYDITISHTDSLPLHTQVYEHLRRLIATGDLLPGDRLPSEPALGRHLAISRNTIRQAFQRAEAEGLIERVPGRGTFVRLGASAQTDRTIAFITGKFDNDFHSTLLNGAERAASARGYRVLFSHVRSREEEMRVLERLEVEKVRGALIWPIVMPPLPAAPSRGAMPIVAVDRPLPGVACDLVTSANYEGARAMMDHLLGLGHRRIAFVTHALLHLSPVDDRLRAYRDALAAAGLAALSPWVISRPGQEFSGDDARRIYQHGTADTAEIAAFAALYRAADPPPTAIFCLNDYIAMMMLRAAALLGVDVPGTLSVAGFDDTDLSAYLEIPLTTVMQDTYTIGSRAAHLLLDHIEHKDTGPARIETVPTRLHPRASTTAPRLRAGPVPIERG